MPFAPMGIPSAGALRRLFESQEAVLPVSRLTSHIFPALSSAIRKRFGASRVSPLSEPAAGTVTNIEATPAELKPYREVLLTATRVPSLSKPNTGREGGYR